MTTLPALTALVALLAAQEPATDAPASSSTTEVAPDEAEGIDVERADPDDTPAGDPPPPVGDAPPPPSAAPVDVDEPTEPAIAPSPALPLPDEPAQKRRPRPEPPDGFDIALGGTAGGLGGTAGAGLALLLSGLLGGVGLFGLTVLGTAALGNGGATAGLFLVGGAIMFAGFTFAGILFALSPAIAAVVAGSSMLLFAVDAEDGDWETLGACAAGIAVAILALAAIVLGASLGVPCDPCRGGGPFYSAGPEGPGFHARPALTWSMAGTAIGGFFGSLALAVVGLVVVPPMAPALGIGPASSGEALAAGFVAFALGLPVGLVIGSAVGGVVGGAVGVSQEE